MTVPLFHEKLALSGVLLIVTVLCSVAPWLVKQRLGKNFTTVLRYMNTLAGGVVMGALLLHMIPELFHQHGTGVHVHHGHGHGNHMHHGDVHVHGHVHHDSHSHDNHHHHDHHDHDHHDHDHHDHDHSHDHEHHDHSHENNHQNQQSKGFLSFITLTDHYPWGCFAAGLSFLFLFYVDRIFFGVDGCHDGHHHHVGHSHSHSGHVHNHNHQKQEQPHHCHDDQHGGDCCNGHQGNGHVKKPTAAAKQVIIQLGHTSANTRTISLERDPPVKEAAVVVGHQHDLVGGCHMDSITGASSQAQTMVFVFALSLHSYLEGLGAAGQCDWTGLSQFAFSLLGHKLLEAFALGVSVMRAGFSSGRTIAVLSFYSFLTPLGILSGMGALHSFSSSSGNTALIVELLNGAAVGSFMFVGMIEMIPPEFNSYDPVHSRSKFAVLCAGFLLMAALNAVGHQH